MQHRVLVAVAVAVEKLSHLPLPRKPSHPSENKRSEKKVGFKLCCRGFGRGFSRGFGRVRSCKSSDNYGCISSPAFRGRGLGRGGIQLPHSGVLI